MHMKRNIAVMAFGMLLAVAALVGIYWYMYWRIDYSTINYIKAAQKGAYNFSDLAGDIDVHELNDLGFEVRGEYDILIHYGRQVIKVNKQCLMSDEWKQRVGAIGIKVQFKKDKDGRPVKYRVTYWDTPIQEWTVVT